MPCTGHERKSPRVCTENLGPMKQFGAFRLDTENQCLWRGSKRIAVRPRPFAVLNYLVEHPGRLISHDEILDALWPDTFVQPQILRTYMLDLRKVLGDDAGEPKYIETLPKRGYQFIAAVAEYTATKARTAPGDSTTEPATVLTGRDAELARLRGEFRSASGGQRRVVWVTGETGIGKTTLVDAFCGELESAGTAAIARGQCVEGLAVREAYYPVTEALRGLCASASGEAACQALARLAPMWLAAVGRGAAGERVVAPQERLPGNVMAALEAIAAESPLVLVFEDVQWADAFTLDLLSALARRRGAARLLIVATVRMPGESAAPSPQRLMQDLVTRQLSSEICLQPLTLRSVQGLLAAKLGQSDLPAGLAGFVHRHSEGNPLFAVALLEHLTAQRILVQEGESGAWKQRAAFETVEPRVPSGLAQMIALEMEQLSAEEQTLLEAGSLMGVAFPAWAVAAALEKDAAAIEDACEEMLRRVHFVHRGGEDELPDGARSAFFVFVHGLYREVLYERQSAARRARRHGRVARRLGELFAGRETDVAREMALHYEAAGEWRPAIDALQAAAKRAEQRAAATEAAELRQQALALSGHLRGAEREAVLRSLGEPAL
jgi:DNA-binding winged helix-turn-helix (wHTH) protein